MMKICHRLWSMFSKTTTCAGPARSRKPDCREFCCPILKASYVTFGGYKLGLLGVEVT